MLSNLVTRSAEAQLTLERWTMEENFILVPFHVQQLRRTCHWP